MSQDSGEAPANAPGMLLSAARERAGLTLQQAAEQLHLDVATLQALESGRYQSLGAAVFVRGHLRRYAELLGIAPTEIEAAFASASGRDALQPDLRRITSGLNAPPPPGTTISPRFALVGAIALVLFGLVWWAMRVPHSHHSSKAELASAASAVASAVTGPAASAEPVAPEGASAPASTVNAPSPNAEAVSGPAPAGSVRLQLVFNEDSWAEIYDAKGARLMFELGAAGTHRKLEGVAPLHILFGNPDGVTLALDGRPVSLAAASDNGQPRRFSLDGGGRVIEVRAPTGAPASPASTP